MYATTNAPNSFEQCFTQCDATSGCQGFTWQGVNGATYGNGAGNCYFKGTGVAGQTITFDGPTGQAEKMSAIKVDQTIFYATTTTVCSLPN